MEVCVVNFLNLYGLAVNNLLNFPVKIFQVWIIILLDYRQKILINPLNRGDANVGLWDQHNSG